MAIVFRDQMEDADETLLSAHTPETGGGAWTVAIYNGGTAYIDTAKFQTGTSSCRLTANNAVQAICTHATSGSGTALNFYYVLQHSASAANQFSQLQLNGTSGKLGVILQLIGTSIYYYNQTSNINSGRTITTNTFYELKITMNTTTGYWSAWIKGGTEYADWTSICTNSRMYNYATWAGSAIVQIYFRSFGNVAGAFTAWWDDFQLGDPDPVTGHGQLLSTHRNRLVFA